MPNSHPHPHKSARQLQAGLDHIRSSPKDEARLELIVRRPSQGEREVLESAELDTQLGLVGDNWGTRGSSRTDDRKAHPDMQINIMSTRVIALIAGPKERWPLAGDQLYVDMDLSPANMPPGTRLHVGTAELEVTDQLHKGCLKFVERFGADAMRFVSSDIGKSLNLRGINARVVKSGVVIEGDMMRRS